MHGTILLVEKLTVHAIWIALHCEGTVLQVRQKRRGNADVVVDHLRLGETRLRIKHLVQIRYLKLPIVDDKFRFLRHGQAKRPTSNAQRPTPNLEGHAQAKKRSGGRTGLGLQIRATQCSQLSCPLRISISTRKK
jgi:hypothetical protein